jgi:2-oxoglutarate ferredoxin oxidoreductase subunit beta
MVELSELGTPVKNTWCPGCGNFGILMTFKNALVELGLEREEVAIVSGIGCHGKITDYVNVNALHTIHGRVLPTATGVKLANHGLTVIGFAGDGDAYNIGIGHLPHAARRNVDITYVIHDNLVYGLTTGQTSPTSKRGYVSKTTPRGSFEPGINPLTQALASEASFVARGFVGEPHHLRELFVQAISHEGFALLDVLQPCVTWNRVNTYQFFRERVYKLEEGHDPGSFDEAYRKAREWGDRIPIGVLYSEERPSYRNNFPALEKGPLAWQSTEKAYLKGLLKEFK